MDAVLRVVFDTNVVISTLLWGGLPRKALEIAAAEGITILVSEEMIAELTLVLNRPKFHPKFEAIAKSPKEVLGEYVGGVEVVSPGDIPSGAIRDPKDRIFLACAIGGKANFIVSGDEDLLILARFQNISILTVTQFLDQFSPK